jgi:cell fate (sporulation/competence/biofilm development) regulator YlbF (YheA/YmcA/DUF963 family)
MTLSNELLEAARELGLALNASPVVQEYLQSRDEVRNHPELLQLEVQIERTYQELVTRQQNGEVLLPDDVNRFYELRETYTNHPLVIKLEQRQGAMKAFIEQTGSTLSSILNIDYTKLVLD